MKKQLIAKLLVLAMVLAMVPATALVASADNSSNDPYAYNVYFDTSLLTNITSTTDTSKSEEPKEDATVTGDAQQVNEAVTADGIEATVVDGEASIALGEAAVESLAELAEDGQIVLEIKADGANKVTVAFPAKALTALGEKTDADLTIKSSVATITIPNAALTTLFKNAGTVTVAAQATGNNIGFSIQADNEALENIEGLQVTF